MATWDTGYLLQTLARMWMSCGFGALDLRTKPGPRVYVDELALPGIRRVRTGVVAGFSLWHSGQLVLTRAAAPLEDIDGRGSPQRLVHGEMAGRFLSAQHPLDVRDGAGKTRATIGAKSLRLAV